MLTLKEVDYISCVFRCGISAVCLCSHPSNKWCWNRWNTLCMFLSNQNFGGVAQTKSSQMDGTSIMVCFHAICPVTKERKGRDKIYGMYNVIS